VAWHLHKSEGTSTQVERSLEQTLGPWWGPATAEEGEAEDPSSTDPHPLLQGQAFPPILVLSQEKGWKIHSSHP
jgi:hypothetical protein